jgi:hypothetical protein
MIVGGRNQVVVDVCHPAVLHIHYVKYKNPMFINRLRAEQKESKQLI